MLNLPTNKKDLEGTMKVMVSAALQRRNARRVEWLTNRYYLDGVRHFTTNFAQGIVTVGYRNTRGKLDYRYEKALKAFTTELGLRMRVDLHPVVDTENSQSLDALRSNSLAQLILNEMVRDIDLDEIHFQFEETRMRYGTVGLALWSSQNLTLGRSQGVVEVLPPWELLPVPAEPNAPGDLQALMRYRVVSEEWMRDKQGLQWPKQAKEKMELVDVTFGENPEIALGSFDFVSNHGTDGYPAVMEEEGADPDKLKCRYGRLVELYIPDELNRLQRYVIMFGGKVLKDQEFPETNRPAIPLAVAPDLPTGGFYGRPFASTIIPTSNEVEQLLTSMFENMRDLDAFGFLMIPTTSGIHQKHFQKAGKPRVIRFEPDMATPDVKPYNIAPANTGDLPGKVANFGNSLVDELSGHSEMLSGDAPGRVDSASGLQLIQETSSIQLGAPLLKKATSFIQLYRAMLDMARIEWDRRNVVSLSMLDDRIMGVVIDPSTGKVSTDRSLIPRPEQVRIRTRSQTPVSPAQRKQELLQMFQLGLVDPDTFYRINEIEGLNFPLGTSARYENWRTAILNNVLLFNDGRTPGQVIGSSESDLADVHLAAIQTFMARPEFRLASPAVRAAFEELKGYYLQLAGTGYPDQMGYPEDEAEMARLMQGNQQGMPQQGPM